MFEIQPSLSPELCQKLAKANPWGRLDVTEDDVRAWFALAWVVMETYHYTNLTRAVCSWWTRAKEEELERARARIRRIAEEQELQRMAELQKAANNVVPLQPTGSHARRVMR